MNFEFQVFLQVMGGCSVPFYPPGSSLWGVCVAAYGLTQFLLNIKFLDDTSAFFLSDIFQVFHIWKLVTKCMTHTLTHAVPCNTVSHCQQLFPGLEQRRHRHPRQEKHKWLRRALCDAAVSVYIAHATCFCIKGKVAPITALIIVNPLRTHLHN